tara:strand:+ start:760 stop:885 length:126 start_codon:yes stop_codon:yes gene_type:complete
MAQCPRVTARSIEAKASEVSNSNIGGGWHQPSDIFPDITDV